MCCLESFGDVWPLGDVQRINIIKCGTAIVRNIDILLVLSDVREEKKRDEEDENSHHDTVIDEFERHTGVTVSFCDRKNLIDLLYNGGCISLLHKQHIEQQPTKQQQNLEMLQLIKNGSIKTFKVALEYFRGTNQDKVFDMLNRKYLSEGKLHL